MLPKVAKRSSPWLWRTFQSTVAVLTVVLVLLALSPDLLELNGSQASSILFFSTTPSVDSIDESNTNSLVESMRTECTESQRQTILAQLPPQDCEIYQGKPWVNKCSFSYATRCPDAIWLTEFWKQPALSETQHPTAIYVGCNKGMDAVNTLRMISANTAFDKTAWRQEFFANALKLNQTIHPGHCGQENVEQFAISSGTGTASPLDASVFCIEAMPQTADQLNRSSYQLGWQNSLVVTNAAVSSTDGIALFPSKQAGQKIGVENMGLADCQNEKTKRHCTEIPQYTLDTYADKFIQKDAWIDFLSIDVEGFDWDVLMGGDKVLERVKYLEFEYNWRGNWKKNALSSTMETLKSKDFVCYWAGAQGHIWRITDCWMEHYNLKFWSNVACVRPQSAPALAARMEAMFQETLAAGTAIKYDH